MTDKKLYFPSIRLLGELSCAPTRDIKLRLEFFNGNVKFVVYNAAAGGIKSPIWDLKLTPIEFIAVMRAMSRILNERIAKNPNNNADSSFVFTTYNAEAQNKRAPVGEIALIYNAESKKIALRVTSKQVDGQLFPIYPSSNVDMSGAVGYTDAGGKAEALFTWVSSWLSTMVDMVTKISVENSIHNGFNPRPRPNSGGGGYGGGYNGGGNGGSKGSGLDTTKYDELDDEIPF